MPRYEQSFLLIMRSRKEVGSVELGQELRRRLPGVRVILLGSSSRNTAVSLTRRQTEVLRLIAVGMTVKEIAHRLDISIKTVETHRLMLTRRLGIRRIPDLVRYAVRTGIVPATWLLE